MSQERRFPRWGIKTIAATRVPLEYERVDVSPSYVRLRFKCLCVNSDINDNHYNPFLLYILDINNNFSFHSFGVLGIIL